MKIKIITATENPMDVISRAAGTSYGKDDVSIKRVKGCFERGHMSVFEHASVTFKVDGISRACSHQLVRHRMASMVQVSQRYTKVGGGDWYVMPPSFDHCEGRAVFTYWMDAAKNSYDAALLDGIKPEDARYLLPEATKTELTVTMNLRELYHFLDLRCDSHAQWEIRYMAAKLLEAVQSISEQWDDLMELWRRSEDEEA